MTDAAPEPVRLRLAMTRVLWPIAIAVPTVPVLAAVLVRPPGTSVAADAFLGTFLVVQAVLLLGSLIAARLLEVEWAHAGLRLASRRESWALLALGGAGALLAIGSALAVGRLASIGGQFLVYGMFGVLVAEAAIIVLSLRALRGTRGRREPHPGPEDSA